MDVLVVLHASRSFGDDVIRGTCIRAMLNPTIFDSQHTICYLTVLFVVDFLFAAECNLVAVMKKNQRTLLTILLVLLAALV